MKKFLRSEEGIAVTEYGLLIALVAIALIAVVTVFGKQHLVLVRQEDWPDHNGLIDAGRPRNPGSACVIVAWRSVYPFRGAGKLASEEAR